jgi:hypothetical protein
MHDQTPRECIQEHRPEDLGAAIFLFVVVPGLTEKVWAWDVSLYTTRLMAVGARAFKWISYREVSRDELLRDSQTANCNQACDTSCVRPGCICDPTAKRCV